MMVHYCIHKIPPLVHILSQINPVHTTLFYISKTNFLRSTHLRVGLLSGLFRYDFPTNKLYAFLFTIRAICPSHLILLGLIILIILGEEYKSRSSPLCNYLHYPVTSSLFGPNILLSILFSNSPSVYVPPLMSEIKFHNHTEPQAKL
jgi:hypothetical protein